MRNGPNAVRTTEGIVVTIKKGTIDQEQVHRSYTDTSIVIRECEIYVRKIESWLISVHLPEKIRNTR